MELEAAMSRLVMMVGLLLVNAEIARGEDLPPGTGTTQAFYSCFSTVECAPKTACVDNGGDGSYYCKPYCAEDNDCRQWPYATTTCLPVVDAGGKAYTPHICNDRPSTLATIISNRTSLAGGPATWYEVALRAPEAQRVRIRIGIRSEDVKNDIRARVAGPAQAAVSAKLGSVDWFNFRFSNPRTTIDSISIGQGSQPNLLNIIVGGTVIAAREQYVWRFQGSHSGMRWEGRGDKDVATFRAHFSVAASATPSVRLKDQTVILQSHPIVNSITINLRPLLGAVVPNAFSVPAVPAHTFPLASVAAAVPDTLKEAQVRYIHFVSVSDAELVLEADAY
jgi:hypothetical protein